MEIDVEKPHTHLVTRGASKPALVSLLLTRSALTDIENPQNTNDGLPLTRH